MDFKVGERNLIELLEKAAGDERMLVHFWKEKSSYSYGEILSGAKTFARNIKNSGLKPKDRVVLVLPTGIDFYFAFFGTLMAGGIPSALYPPVRFALIDEWKRKTASCLDEIESRFVVTDKKIYPLIGGPLRESQARPKVLTTSELLKTIEQEFAFSNVHESDIAFIQFSSGSTGKSKAVPLTHKNILANTKSFLEGFEMKRKEMSCVSWLPLYHDMGLIGGVIGALYAIGPLTLLPPELFVVKPSEWFKALSETRATITIAPNFAFGLSTKKISDVEIKSFDLTQLRVALCGGENNDEFTLSEFNKKFKPAGLCEKVITPVYGLAEATLAVSFSSPMSEMKGDCDRDGNLLINCGKPLNGIEVEVRNREGERLLENQIGEIWIKGDNVISQYWNNREPHKFDGLGWFNTEDQGFIRDGNLFPCGRTKDIIILNGRNYDPAVIEQTVSQISGVRTGCVVAFGVFDSKKGSENLYVALESSERDSELNKIVSKKIGHNHSLSVSKVIILAPGSLPRTSSGKLRRSETKRKFINGQLSSRKNVGKVFVLKEVAKGYRDHLLS